jgi:putative spermidine/putrescine transport system permease protein
VTLPLIRPGILAGAFIAFMSSFDNAGFPVPAVRAPHAADPHVAGSRRPPDVTITAVSGVMIAITIVA